MRTTLMACDMLQTEDMVHEVLGETNNYTINSDTLSLSKGSTPKICGDESKLKTRF